MVRILLAATLLPTLLAAQDKPAAPPVKTWMDLRVGTDATFVCEDANEAEGGMGSGGAGKRDVRLFCLGTDDAGRLRITLLVEQPPKESFETALLRTTEALLDPATGELRDAAGEARGPDLASDLALFVYPPLSAAEWKAKAKKGLAREMWVSVAGESVRLPLQLTFGQAKEGKKSTPTIVGQLDGKEAAVQLVGIAGLVAMAEGRMPRLGASGVEPVDATVSTFRIEYLLDPAKGRVTEVRSTCAVAAAGGKLKIAGKQTLRETNRRECSTEELAALAPVVAELTTLLQAEEPKPERRARAVALQEQAKKVGLERTWERLIDALTRNGLPPGIGR